MIRDFERVSEFEASEGLPYIELDSPVDLHVDMAMTHDELEIVVRGSRRRKLFIAPTRSHVDYMFVLHYSSS